MEFGRAVDLIEKLKQQVELHGEDLRVGLYVDQETVETAGGSVCGPVKLDSVEKTAPPRLDLTFMDSNCSRKLGIKTSISWHKDLSLYGTGEICYLGKWRVGGWHYGGVKGSSDYYRLNCALPGIKSDLGRFDKPEKAKVEMERVIVYWLERLNETPDINQ